MMPEPWRPGFEHPKFAKRVGRPPVPESRQLRRALTVRLSDRDLRRVNEFASLSGIKVAEFMRIAILAALEPETVPRVRAGGE
jgi:hypothetical protein